MSLCMLRDERRPFEAVVTTRAAPEILGQHPHQAVIYVWVGKNPACGQITPNRYPALFEAMPDLRTSEVDGYLERVVTVCSEVGLCRAKRQLRLQLCQAGIPAITQ